MSDQTAPTPFAYCAIDGHGQVIVRGATLTLPDIPGLTVLAESAPPGCYRQDAQWIDLPERPSAQHSFDWATKQWVDPRSLDDIRAAKLREINAAFRLASAELVVGYPAEERQTWAAQEGEALAWEADSATPTPYLDGIAAARGIQPAEMRVKTLESVLAFRAVSQWLVGTRQGLRDAIASPIATREQIEAIAWPSPSQE